MNKPREEVLIRIADRVGQAYEAWKTWDGGTGYTETGEVDESEENEILRDVRDEKFPPGMPESERNRYRYFLKTKSGLKK